MGDIPARASDWPTGRVINGESPPTLLGHVAMREVGGEFVAFSGSPAADVIAGLEPSEDTEIES